jgi:glyoxylase-like metal-dependent hydrolase (beta-lactamase superfamily II)
MAYVNGPAMRHAVLRAGYEAADIQAATALLHGGRMVLHDGTVDLAPGLSLHHVGGHTDGLQMVRVRTRRGWMCLATDAVAHRQNLERRIPFPAVLHVGDALEAFDTGLALADAPDLLIPGHDCWVVDAHPGNPRRGISRAPRDGSRGSTDPAPGIAGMRGAAPVRAVAARVPDSPR